MYICLNANDPGDTSLDFAMNLCKALTMCSFTDCVTLIHSVKKSIISSRYGNMLPVSTWMK